MLEQFSLEKKSQIFDRWCYKVLLHKVHHLPCGNSLLKQVFSLVHGVFKLAKLLPSLKGKFMIIVLVSKFLGHVQEFS